MNTSSVIPIGDQLRTWRGRRRLSQLDLALTADISQRHLSFVENGRAKPSREMVLALAECLQVPLRDRNQLLLGAGYAPVFHERSLDESALAAARNAVQLLLAGHEPYPALAVDRHWNLVMSNRAVQPFLYGTSPDLLVPPINVLRLSLHPDGMAPRIRNLAQWRSHVLLRLRQQIDVCVDEELLHLHDELAAYPAPASTPGLAPRDTMPANNVVIPLCLSTADGDLALISATTIFGTPVDITLSELAIETFFPANDETGERLRQIFTASCQ
jgi:transcriptional regulator with XRE-family HTH domain